jgi:hypothetical protein
MRAISCIASVVVISSILAAASLEPSVVYLWPNGAPGSEGKTGEETVQIQPAGDHVISNVHRPSITVYLPSKETATGVGIVIAPGGGHNCGWIMKDTMSRNGFRIVASRALCSNTA